MKPSQKFVRILAVLALLVTSLTFYCLQPHLAWKDIQLGMTKDEVAEIIPEFDNPMSEAKADFEEESRFGLQSIIGVNYTNNKVSFIQREIWTSWPQRWKLWQSVKNRFAEQDAAPNH